MRELPIVINDVIEYKDFLYAWDVNHNTLWKMDKLMESREILIDYVQRGVELGCLYSKVVFENGRLYGVPQDANDVFIYDMDTQKTSLVKIPFHFCEPSSGMFWDGVIIDSSLYIIGYNSPYILEFDINKCKFVSFIKIENVKNKTGNIFFKWTITLDDNIYIPCCGEGKIVVFNVNTKNYQIIKCNIYGEGFLGIMAFNNKIWLTPKHVGPLICLDMSSKNFCVENALDNGGFFSDTKYEQYGYIIERNSDIYLFPLKANKILKIDKEKSVIADTKLKELNIDSGNRDIPVFNMVKKISNIIILSSWRFGCFVIIDDTSVKTISAFPSEDEKKYFNSIILKHISASNNKSSIPLSEEEGYLPAFIEMVSCN